MKIVEIFFSLQGEGANVGKPAIFIRLANCNLNCDFCDTEWKNGIEIEVEKILKKIEFLMNL
jgi:organic radical activating enzyme